ncbi:MAG: RsmD family RNA methyltransferase [Saprospiraceae bacterium]|nr:RsmD family RNA methyltransferase [Saprospiraceae bacterium]MDW8483296.1 RsmD family RNA methyltransferase [Saprospiraceae bacterium]
MRIIGGKFKGRRFEPPFANWPTRPTTDLAREALFNILTHLIDFESVKMLDLFGGTGCHCYEFISRGCTDTTYVDKFPGCVRFVRQMALQLGIEPYLKIYQMDVFRFILFTSDQYDYIFAGPPYNLPALETLPDKILKANILKPGGILVLEHNPQRDFSYHPRLTDVRRYGQTYFSFFRGEQISSSF